MYKSSDNLGVNYIVSKLKALCKYFNMNIPWKELGAPCAMAAVKISTTLILTLDSSLLIARTSVATVSVLNILSRKPAVTITVWIFHENKKAHLESWWLWRTWPLFFWRRNTYHLVRVQVRRQSRCHISCPESPLRLFQFEYYVKTRYHTFNYGGSEELNRTASDVGIIIT